MRLILVLIFLALAVVGCGEKSSNGSAKAASASAASAASSAGGGTSAAPPSALVTLATVDRATVARKLVAYGTVEYAPDGARSVTVDVEEVVDRLMITVGQSVARGDALMTLVPSATTRAQFAQLRVGADFARKDAERLVGLRTRGLATNADVQSAEKNAASAEAQLTSMAQRGYGDHPHVVRARVAGTVQAVSVALGQLVAAGMPLVTIGDARHTRVRLGVALENLAEVQAGDRVEIRPLNGDAAAIVSKVEQVFSQVDSKTGLADVVAPLPAGHGLLPGAWVQAQIVVVERLQALVVPRSAVLYQQQKPYVFVDQGGHAHRRDVVTGIEESDRIEVTKGLSASERVIASGNAQVEEGMAVRTESTP